jgi:transcriptional antiterminator RfaH
MLEANSWFAIQTRAQREVVAVSHLASRGYEVFLPTRRPSKASRGSGGLRERALFPGYFFCRLRPEVNEKIVTTPGVIRIVGYGRSPVPINEHEIVSMRTIVRLDVNRQPWSFLTTGTRIRIETGPLRGLEGILASNRNGRLLVASIMVLQKSTAVELSPDTIISAA